MRITLGSTIEMQRAIALAKGRATQEAARAMYQEGEAIMAESKRLVPVDMGTLRNSGLVELPVIAGDKVSVTLGYGGAASGYALYIHEGTGPAVGRPPFMPPVAPFREWARRVLGNEGLGYVIARSVGRKGLAPRKFLERPFNARAQTMDVRLASRIRSRMGGR